LKLKLLFIVMVLLTLLAYPIVFGYGKLRRFFMVKDRTALANPYGAVPATSAR
jgi:hypothetical protein